MRTVGRVRGRGPAGSLWRHRDFMLLWSGHTVSLFGSQISWIALPMVAVAGLRATTFEVAVLGAMSTLPALVVSLPAGVLADRHRRRPLMIACDAGSALAMASVPIAAVLGRVTMAQLYAVTLVVGALGVLFGTASGSLTPVLLGGGRLTDANAKMNTARGLAEMAGPSVGGFLVGLVGAARAVAADALSYAVSAAALASMRLREPKPERAPHRGRFLGEIAEGLRFVLAHPVLRVLALSGAISAVLLRGISSMWLLYVVRELGWSPRAAGLVYGLSLIGGIAGSMVAARVTARLGIGRVIVLGALLSAPFELVTPLVPPGLAGQWTVGLVFTFLTAAGMVQMTAAQTARQLLCPPGMLGRMNGSTRFLGAGLLPLGPLLAGALGAWIGLRPALIILGGATLLWPLLLSLSPVRALDGR
ncbi:Transmembrane secretion effector [Microbispora rosea]|uniref:Transmembrane secretion effector n=1 Tax=Microbispora rosea TaxID=58117 RepID=A0A1N6QWL2_9ACTN|nr:Transmembrane secretion effector [Microbispora rosea]